MERVSVLQNTRINNDIAYRTNVTVEKKSFRRNGFDPAITTLIAEGGVNFFRYINSLGMSRETNLVVLSSRHHYYYDENDLKGVRILINLKKLNLIKHLDFFLNTLVRILPPDTYFIGYFSDSKTAKGNGFQFNRLPGLFNRLNNFLDSRTDRIMSKNEVIKVLERNGFKTIDMTEINGHTYFKSQNIKPVVS